MHALQTVLSILAATSLAAALLVPLRDDRRGKRATIGGRVPLLASFPSVRPGDAVVAADAGEQNEAPDGPVMDPPDTVKVVTADQPPGKPLSRFFDRHVSARIIDALRLGIFARHAATRRADDVPEEGHATPPIEPVDATATPKRQRSFAEELQLASASPDDAELRNDIERPTTDPTDRLQIVSALRQAQGDMTEDSLAKAAGDAAATGEASTAVAGAMRAVDAAQDARAAHAASEARASGDASTGGYTSTNDRAGANDNAGVAGDPSAARDANETRVANAARIANADGRTWSVPPTRLPLRRVQAAVLWPLELPIPQIAASRADRHATLSRLVGNADASCERALRAAYEQEDRAGRIIALQALEHVRGDVSRSVLVDALGRGTDEERVVAVDALARRGDREALIEGLADRVDAIAARAALGLVETNVRADFERALAPLVDCARLHALLTLLAPALR